MFVKQEKTLNVQDLAPLSYSNLFHKVVAATLQVWQYDVDSDNSDTICECLNQWNREYNWKYTWIIIPVVTSNNDYIS